MATARDREPLRSQPARQEIPGPVLPTEALEIIRLVGARSRVIGEKSHRVWMSTVDATGRLRDLEVDDEDLESLLDFIRIDLDEIKRDLERIASLGRKLGEVIGETWLRRQLDGLKDGA